MNQHAESKQDANRRTCEVEMSEEGNDEALEQQARGTSAENRTFSEAVGAGKKRRIYSAIDARLPTSEMRRPSIPQHFSGGLAGERVAFGDRTFTRRGRSPEVHRSIGFIKRDGITSMKAWKQRNR